MRTILIILQKEFKQIFRNKGMIPIIFVMPLVQLIILVNAATFEIKGLKIFIIDKDLSITSRRLISKFEGSAYFDISGYSFESEDGERVLQKGEVDLFLEIPSDFEKYLFKEGEGKVQLVINAIDGIKGGLANGYAQSIITDLNRELIRETVTLVSHTNSSGNASIDIVPSNWYNPDLEYKSFMVPGILVLLVTMIGAFLSSMNVVREKEIGTIEQLNVTPIRKHHFIIGKLVPFWIIAIFELAFGMVLAKIIYDIPLVGSIGLVFGFSGVYLLVVLGLGLFVSTVTETQQQAMFISWFFLVIFILMSGLFTPIENMPAWAQKITLFNPAMYFMEVIRMVLLKGAGFIEIQWHFTTMLVFAFIINFLAVLRYRKTS